jgi:hypothetical protein
MKNNESRHILVRLCQKMFLRYLTFKLKRLNIFIDYKYELFQNIQNV